MNLEIHTPELEERVRAHIRSGRFHDTDELLTKAFDALEEKTSIAPEIEALRRKNFMELCDPVRGLAEDVDFSRNPSTARPLDL
jgi:Arc/MetJ-type ribon-helix-helix transcriptional regulator